MDNIKEHYDEKYFKWQSKIGIFGAIANMPKFDSFISDGNKVLDFGCGGGYLIDSFEKKIEKHGFEINKFAIDAAKNKNIKIHTNFDTLNKNYFDVIISNHTLEHVSDPFNTLKKLHECLKNDGKIIIVVPLDGISLKYNPKNKDKHLYSWSPMNLGNILNSTGFNVIESKPYNQKWMPYYYKIQKLFGWKIFFFLSYLWSKINRRFFQVRAIAIKKTNF